MKLTVTRGELKELVSGFAKIIPGKTGLSVLTCVRFAIENGDLTAQATDLDQTAVYRFDNAEAEGEGEIIVSFPVLKELGKGTGAETVTLENDGSDIAVTNTVGGHAVTSTVAGTDSQDWPPAGSDIPTTEAKGFLNAYRRMAPFASVDETRRTLCAVYIDVSGEGDHNATLVACDGRRLCCCNSMKLHVDDENGVMIPVSKFLLWNGLPADVQMGVSKTKDGSRVCVRGGHWTYRVKAVDGVFPNWRQVIPVAENMSHRITFTDAEVEALRKIVPAFPGTEGIVLEGSKDGNLSLCGMDRESATALTVPLTAGSSYEGAGCRVTVNRHYLLDALSAGFRNFLFADTVSPLLSDDGNGAKHVLMPLRHEGPAKPAQQPEPADEKAAQTLNPIQKPEPVPAPEPEQPKEKHEMTNENTVAQEPTALEKLQAAYDTAKNKVREAQSALADVASAIRDAVKEDRQRRSEVETVRAGLLKLQSIKV